MEKILYKLIEPFYILMLKISLRVEIITLFFKMKNEKIYNRNIRVTNLKLN